MLVDLALHSQALEKELASLRSSNSLPDGSAVTVSSLTISDEDPPLSCETDPTGALGSRLEGFCFKRHSDHHFGKSSQYKFIQTALDARDDLNGGQTEKTSLDLKRSEFWELKPWHVTPQYQAIPYEYPPNDLLKSLLALYWEHFHPFYPLLHRPTFEKSLAAKLHMYDRPFGATVLAVCALASRYSADPRVLYDNTTSMHSAGWKYFNQIEFVPKSLVGSFSVHVLQVYPLSVTFMLGTHMAEASWILIGRGIQLAQMIGVHRSSFGKGRNPVDVELWKRAFWQLEFFDTSLSMALGRPRLSNPNDLDLDLPAVCDDEYWETPNPDDAFKQPENIPSKLTFWIHYIKLAEIVGFAQRSLVNPWGPTTLSTAEWNQKAVVELDSALNNWVDALPDFLKYNPHQEDDVFARQSVMLYAEFYLARIQIHKRFMCWPGQKSIVTFPSLAICANAARSCVHLLNGHHQRCRITFPHFIPPIFSCAIVLSTNLWRGIQSKISLNVTKEMNEVHSCLDMLALYEDKFEMAGRLRDIFLSVISASPLPPIEKLPSLKRTRSRYEGNSIPVNSVEDDFSSGINTGSQQTQCNSSTAEMPSGSFNVNISPNADWSLPVTSDDLGGMPVHLNVGADMGVPFNSMAYGSENTLPSQGLDGMTYELRTGQFSNTSSSSQTEWDQFMAEVDELLQLVGYPSAGQL
ncbi:hypothetical protein GYMLUDRAFT_215462 [Collybiopsis luxurians FD-317 M1]|nr:hypothetical protein GYMLUDRAFT_215462 [Collybiopsis luxurians FD-317 M1]